MRVVLNIIFPADAILTACVQRNRCSSQENLVYTFTGKTLNVNCLDESTWQIIFKSKSNTWRQYRYVKRPILWILESPSGVTKWCMLPFDRSSLYCVTSVSLHSAIHGLHHCQWNDYVTGRTFLPFDQKVFIPKKL